MEVRQTQTKTRCEAENSYDLCIILLVALSRKPQFETETWSDRLGGVVAIKASAVSEPAGAWRDTLYAPEPKRSAKRRTLVAIPYYANLNRGPAKMAVWIPQET